MTESDSTPRPEDNEQQPSIDLEDVADELRKPAAKVEMTTQEQEQEQERRVAARVQTTLEPQVVLVLRNLQRTGALARMPKDLERIGLLNLSTVARQESLAKRLGALNLPSKTLSELMPKAGVQPPWARQLKLLNSDLYRIKGLGQPNLTTLNMVLARNADFGFSDYAAKIAAQFATQQNSWLKTIGPLLANLKTNFYPSNLRDNEGLKLEEVEAVAMLDGIGLYGVPRREIAEKLIRAADMSARREILGRRWIAISADCRSALESCSSTSVAMYVSFTLDALDALDGGHSRPAQALAASVLDTIVNGYFGSDRVNYTPDRSGVRTTAAYDELTLMEFLAFAPLWQAYQQFRPDQGDPIPTLFNRHATIHGVSTRQFSRRNAVQALLFVTGLLVFLDDEAQALESS